MSKEKKIYLCSFASPDLKRSVLRFKKQASRINVYKNIKVYSYNDLSLEKKYQIDNFKINNKKRLFGYGCWKAEIINDFMSSIPKDAVLQYSDIGCHLNSKGEKKLLEYYDLTVENDILAFQYKKPRFNFNDLEFQIYYEYENTKGDLFNHFNLNLNSEVSKTEQFWSGSVFFKNNEKSKVFLKKWMDICKIDNLIDDETSKIGNHKNFKEHRHDQSVFSIICKLYKVFSVSASEAEWAENSNGRTWSHLENFPILAKRDKKYNLFTRFINRQKRNINRFLKK